LSLGLKLEQMKQDSDLSGDALRLKALRMLMVATAFWGLSFPTTKALAISQQELLSASSSWFVASLCAVYRFAIAALVLLALSGRSLTQLTRLELEQGLGLGLFGGVGILLQIDGMAYTSASSSAFLTQCYCLWLPIWVAWRERHWPPAKVFLSCALVMIGVAALTNLDWKQARVGRGEWETIAASLAFTGQILWLERPQYTGTNPRHFSFVMFLVMAGVALPVAFVSTRQWGDWFQAYRSAPTLGFLGILILFCTCGGYLLMNRWQRRVSAIEAGLIYCLEPVFASAFVLFLPAWFSSWAAIAYANEKLTASLLVGGGLITAANVLLQLPSFQPEPAAANSAMPATVRRNRRIVDQLDDTTST
jgi:drug/metabolite transporter (DMT)-like permease